MKRWPKLTAILRRLLLALAVVATLLAIGIVVENWRGDRAWAAVERDLRARGEPLDLAAFQTPRIPDERNFFKAPALENLLYAKQGDSQNKKLLAEAKLSEIETALSHRNDRDGDRAVLKALVRSRLLSEPFSPNPATDILAAMKPAEALLDAVVQAARDRPDAWLAAQLAPPFSSDQRQLDVGAALSIARVLAGRAKARLELGQPDSAGDDIKAVLKLSDAFNAATPKPLLSVLVAQAMRSKAADVIKEGCIRHLWNKSQLTDMQNMLETQAPFVAFRQSLQTERIWTKQMLDFPPPFDLKGVLREPALLPRWLIRGWAQQNKVAASTNVDALLAVFDPATGRIYPDRLQSRIKSAAILRNSRSPYVVVVRRIAQDLAHQIQRFGSEQNLLRQAVIACALERVRLDRGRYPDSLIELTPAYIPAVPTDVFTGQPFGYVRNLDGGFTLTATAEDGQSVGKVWTQTGER